MGKNEIYLIANINMRVIKLKGLQAILAES